MSEPTEILVHLRVHSAYSLLEGALTIPRLVALAAADHMPALAITDSNNLFGALEFSEAVAGSRIQPIMGCTLTLSFVTAEEEATNVEIRRPQADGRIALLAKDAEGYANLMRLSSNAYLAGAESGEVVTSIRQLAAHADGLIALTGGPEGVIDLALAEANPDLARARLASLKRIFGDRLYVELQRHGLSQERAIEPVLLDLAYEAHLPIVAS
ncbi:MAG: PHP domain-containing protein, partial [Methyloceanibacter sp.]